ncbi:hypothetical protein FACS1894204_06860 [Synergistales bacterium]|nr:hypothetical protein FACS1894204_06860 [Synergistales bacterium]
MLIKKKRPIGGYFMLALFLFACVFVGASGRTEAEAATFGLKSYTQNGNEYEYVLFGRYPQDSDGNNGFLTQPILWRVLSGSRSDALTGNPIARLLSDKNLDAMVFDDDTPHWGDSFLRKWMNDEVSGFKRVQYFTTEEQSVISPATYDTYDENGNRLKDEDGNFLPSTTCYFYAPSYDEDPYISDIDNSNSNKTFPEPRRIALNTAYTARISGMSAAGSADDWWLRSPASITSNTTNSVWTVNKTGGLSKTPFQGKVVAVRPVVNLNRNSLIYKSASSSSSTEKAGSESNPYFLYLSTIAKDPVSAIVSGSTLTLTFNAADKVVHAYDVDLNETSLRGSFTVKKNGSESVTVNSAKVEGNNVVLTLASSIPTTDTGITVSYMYSTQITNGLGFLGDGKALSEFLTTNFPVTAPAAPDITTQPPANQSATENGSTTFTVAASGAPAPTYQWQVSTNNGTTFANVTGSVYSGATTATLKLTSVPASFNGYKYRCVASNGIGSATSNVATLTVNYATPVAVINYTTEKLTGLFPNAQYNINGTVYPADENGEIDLASSWLSGSLTIFRVGVSGGVGDSGSQNLLIPSRPLTPTGLNGVAPTAPTANDGKITGTATEMEYKYTNTSSAWTPCAASQTTNLAPGEYLVRYKVTGNSFVSATTTVYVKEATPAAAIDYVAEKLTGLASAAYLFNGTNETLSATTRDIDGSWMTGTSNNLSIVKVNEKPGANSEAQNLTIPARPAAPNVTPIPPSVIGGTGGINGTTTAMEYKSSAGSWADCTAPSVTGLAPGTYNVRVKAVTGNAFSGLETTLTLNPFGGSQETTPNAAIDYIGEKLTDLVAGADYIFNYGTSDTRTADGDGKIAIDTSWFGKPDLSIVKKGDDMYTTNSEAQNLTIPSRPAAPVVTGTPPTAISGTGEINNTTAAMEYQLSSSTDWTVCTDPSVTDLAPGTYYVRVKAVAVVAGGNGNFFSLPATVTIDQFNSTREPTPSVTINYELEKIIGLAGNYLIGGASTNVTGDLAIDDAWFGTTLSIVKKGDGITTTDSEALNQNIPSRPASPNVAAIQPVIAGGNGGIGGTTAAMDYKPSASAETAYAPCAETETTGLAPGVYDVRFIAVPGVSFKSAPSTVTIIALANAQTPLITTHPQSGAVNAGSSVTLSVAASVTDGGTLSYQWYDNGTTNGNVGGTAVGTNSASYSPSAVAVGTKYYYVVVTNTNDGVSGIKTATAVSDAAWVTISDPVETLLKYIMTNTGLTAAATGETITVTGKPTHNGPIALDTTANPNIKIEWNASYAGNSPGALITVTGGGALEIGNESNISNGGGNAIASDGDIVISGGVISASGGNIAVFTTKNVEVLGGKVSSDGTNGTAIYAGGEVSVGGGVISARGTGGAAINATGTVTMNGNAVISSAEDVTLVPSPKKGILIEGNEGFVYGDVVLDQSFTIPFGVTLTIGDGGSLTNNALLINEGTIDNTDGEIINNGTIRSGASILNTEGVVNNYGTIDGLGTGAIDNTDGAVNNYSTITNITIIGNPVNEQDGGRDRGNGGGSGGCDAGAGAGVFALALSFLAYAGMKRKR